MSAFWLGLFIVGFMGCWSFDYRPVDILATSLMSLSAFCLCRPFVYVDLLSLSAIWLLALCLYRHFLYGVLLSMPSHYSLPAFWLLALYLYRPFVFIVYVVLLFVSLLWDVGLLSLPAFWPLCLYLYRSFAYVVLLSMSSLWDVGLLTIGLIGCRPFDFQSLSAFCICHLFVYVVLLYMSSFCICRPLYLFSFFLHRPFVHVVLIGCRDFLSAGFLTTSLISLSAFCLCCPLFDFDLMWCRLLSCQPFIC